MNELKIHNKKNKKINKIEKIINSEEFVNLNTDDIFIPEIGFDFSFSKHSISRINSRLRYFSYDVIISEIKSIMNSIKNVKNRFNNKIRVIKTCGGFRIKYYDVTHNNTMTNTYVITYRGIRYIISVFKYNDRKKYYLYNNDKFNILKNNEVYDEYYKLITCYVEDFNL